MRLIRQGSFFLLLVTIDGTWPILAANHIIWSYQKLCGIVRWCYQKHEEKMQVMKVIIVFLCIWEVKVFSSYCFFSYESYFIFWGRSILQVPWRPNNKRYPWDRYLYILFIEANSFLIIRFYSSFLQKKYLELQLYLIEYCILSLICRNHWMLLRRFWYYFSVWTDLRCLLILKMVI